MRTAKLATFLLIIGGILTERCWGQEVGFPRKHLLRGLTSAASHRQDATLLLLRRQHAADPRVTGLVEAAVDHLSRRPAGVRQAARVVQLLDTHRDEASRRYLVDTLKRRELPLVMTALDVLAARNDDAVVLHAPQLFARPEFDQHFGFRLSLLLAVTRQPGDRTTEMVLDKLPILGGRAADVAFEYLRRVSEADFGEDKLAWQAWWKNEERLPISEERFHDEGQDEPPSYYGLPIREHRLLFVIDKSGSMSDPLGDGMPGNGRGKRPPTESRMMRAKRELADAIGQLPPSAHFGIVTFDERVAIWQPRLLPATAANKLAAARFVAEIVPDGETAWYDALHASMQIDANLEAIYFLSDGTPTVGKIVSAPLIIEAISAENRFRRIAVHTIGLGVGVPAQRFLKSLSDQNEGRYRSMGSSPAAMFDEVTPVVDVSRFTPTRVLRRPMPPITRVRKATAKTIGRRIKDDELVLGVVVNGDARAYPINMINGPDREIINDVLGGLPIAATW